MKGPEGGSVRVAVWAEPDPGAPTLGGAAVRALVLPQLFYAKPDGSWAPQLVEPGSDATAEGATSATFRIRDGASWSNGEPVTVEDLRRTADGRFVAGIDGPDAGRSITVRFTQALPGWRRLWSGTDSIAPPAEGVWGGPFAVAARTPGLETTLERNPGWAGPRPHLDEIRLVVVPEATMARQLLAGGDLDVIAPLADRQRTPALQRLSGVEVATASAAGGWWVGLHLDPQGLDLETRRAVSATIDRRRFVDVLLAGEATVLDGFLGGEDGAWRATGWTGDEAASRALRGLRDETVDLVGMNEEPLTYLLHRSMQKRARLVDARFELRSAEADRVAGWLRDGSFEAAVTVDYHGPSLCWRCRWSGVDEGLAASADAGDRDAAAALQAKVVDEALLVPLWRPVSVAAWRRSVVEGVRPNPYGLSAAWDAWRWHRP